MSSVLIDDSVGIKVSQGGSGLQVSTTMTLSSSPKQSVTALTADSTVTLGGVYTVTGTSAVTTTMPLASSVPGSVFVFRNVSAKAHALTGSLESNGTLVFSGMPGATPDTTGSKLTLLAAEGASVALISDGRKFLVMAASGSCTINGT